MPTAQVKIQFKDAPKEGKKNWKLKDTNRVYYSIPPELAAQVHEGETVTLDYEEKVFNGYTTNMVKSLSHGDVPGSSPAPAAPTPRPPAPSAPTPRNGNGHSTSQEMEAKRIYCCGVVQCAMKSGQFKPEDIPTLTQFAAEAWEAFLR